MRRMSDAEKNYHLDGMPTKTTRRLPRSYLYFAKVFLGQDEKRCRWQDKVEADDRYSWIVETVLNDRLGLVSESICELGCVKQIDVRAANNGDDELVWNRLGSRVMTRQNHQIENETGQRDRRPQHVRAEEVHLFELEGYASRRRVDDTYLRRQDGSVDEPRHVSQR